MSGFIKELTLHIPRQRSILMTNNNEKVNYSRGQFKLLNNTSVTVRFWFSLSRVF